MSREERTQDRDGEGRAKRVPLGLQRNDRLQAETPTGYIGRWMNDDKQRIDNALKGGYVFAKDGKPVGAGVENKDTDLGQFTSQVVGTKEDGSPLRAYWMLIKKEWYEEDQREKLKPVDEIENAIKHGKVGQDKMSTGDRSNTYIPSTGIKIE